MAKITIDLKKIDKVIDALARVDEDLHLTVKEHKLLTRWNSTETADGHCTCGKWSFPGWTARMGTVRDSYQSHLWNLLEETRDAQG